jgi:nucleotide-binding universal stress UspA family protein
MYKTILVHCNDQRRIRSLLAPAVGLAEISVAHLHALSVVPPIAVISGGAESSPMVIDEHCKLYRDQNPTMRAAFDDAVRGRGLVPEWQDSEAGTYSVADCVLPYARSADLVIASQTDPAWLGSNWLDIADRLVLESGRPVLVVPNTGRHERLSGKVLVAWNGRREAARAIFDALPILQRAMDVKVVWVNPQSESDIAIDFPAADICAALARHSVKCEATQHVLPSAGVGETLSALATEFGADLLVMGCYGHTRLREFVFGGASRYILQNMSIPVLMSH